MPRGYYPRPPREPCLVEACGQPRFGHGYCNAHYKRWKKTGDPGEAEPRRNPERGCSVEGCDRAHRSRGYCATHWRRMYDSGEEPTTLVAPMKFLGIKGECLRPGCNLLSYGSGYCARHYRRQILMVSYGLSGWEEFDLLWERCGGRCEICGCELEQNNRATAIDHDHDRLVARGILCNSCNTGLGGLRDSPELLEAALVYLRRHEEAQ